jgi:hypothetical protein
MNLKIQRREELLTRDRTQSAALCQSQSDPAGMISRSPVPSVPKTVGDLTERSDFLDKKTKKEKRERKKSLKKYCTS